jgi:hypothetical protein
VWTCTQITYRRNILPPSSRQSAWLSVLIADTWNLCSPVSYRPSDPQSPLHAKDSNLGKLEYLLFLTILIKLLVIYRTCCYVLLQISHIMPSNLFCSQLYVILRLLGSTDTLVSEVYTSSIFSHEAVVCH